MGLFWKSKEEREQERVEKERLEREEREKMERKACAKIEREAKREEERKLKIEECKQEYETQRREFGFVRGKHRQVTLNGISGYMWRDDEGLKFFEIAPPNWDIDPYKKRPGYVKRLFKIGNIQYFQRDGQLTKETRVTGVERKPNMAGAIIGGAIAGGTGAIIGATSGTTTINSHTITHDTRTTLLVHQNKVYKLAPKDYEVLLALIPEKEITVVKSSKQRSKTTDTVEKMRQLNMMKEEGLITQSEYDTKKAEILNAM